MVYSDPDKHRAANKRWYKKVGPEYYRRQRKLQSRRDRYNIELRYKYGITIDDYDVMWTNQDGRCAICGATNPGGQRTHFCVDHDHQTGIVRGLLCRDCNKGLGAFRDSQSALKAAIKYLQEYQ